MRGFGDAILAASPVLAFCVVFGLALWLLLRRLGGPKRRRSLRGRDSSERFRPSLREGPQSVDIAKGLKQRRRTKLLPLPEELIRRTALTADFSAKISIDMPNAPATLV